MTEWWIGMRSIVIPYKSYFFLTRFLRGFRDVSLTLLTVALFVAFGPQSALWLGLAMIAGGLFAMWRGI